MINKLKTTLSMRGTSAGINNNVVLPIGRRSILIGLDSLCGKFASFSTLMVQGSRVRYKARSYSRKYETKLIQFYKRTQRSIATLIS